MTQQKHRVVIVGGGFGGLQVAKSLKRADVSITLVDRRNFHLFQPLLYQVAGGALSPANIASPLRKVLSRQQNVRVLMADVVKVDPVAKKISFAAGDDLAYDTLIVAAGATHSYFGHDEWEDVAPGLKTIEDATEIRRRILSAFEAAEREDNLELRRAWLTFTIIGAGPTGVELAGTIAEISRHTLKHDFRRINPADARIIVIDAEDQVLPGFPQDLAEKAMQSLKRLGVEVLTNRRATEITATKVVATPKGDGEPITISTRTTLWAAGVQASPLGKKIAESTGAETDRAGRIFVEPRLHLKNHSDIYVIGDLAHFAHNLERPLPGVAQVAMQQGKFVATKIKNQLRGKETTRDFIYKDYGSLATIGRSSAVAQLGSWKFSGFTAWVIWLIIHLLNIVQFENRLLVLMQWGWNYITFNRSARLITGDQRPSKHLAEKKAKETAEV